MTTALIDVPAGLNGVAVTDTSIGDVSGDAGTYHYRGHDAVELARHRTFEDVWFLFHETRLPTADESAAFTRRVAEMRRVPDSMRPMIDAVADAVRTHGTSPLAALRTVLSASAGPLGLRPLIDLDERERRDQALRLAAIVPSVLAAIHRRSGGQSTVEADPSLGHAAAYLHESTGVRPDDAAARAIEQYLILTIDHGFNASTFTGRVAASTGADLADCVCAAIGALAGPLHGGAPGRALDALDAIGEPSRARRWVEVEVAAGRRIMGFGHAVYRDVDPRSALLREVADRLGGPIVDRARQVETEILRALADLKPDRPLPSNVEFYAGVVMETVGVPRTMFTPTFAVSRTVGWCTHAVEQASIGKLIRPSSRYVGAAPAASAADAGSPQVGWSRVGQ